MTIDERELRLAREHPRGTERRTLLAYRDALNDVGAYARLPVADRDAIVRWVEVRRRLREEDELDHDPANLADPLLPYRALLTHVIAGERVAAGRRPDVDADGADANADGDVRDIVARIRAG